MGHAETLDRTIDADTPLVPPPPACAELLARTARWWPAAARAGLAAARIGVRPVPADGVSIAGPAPGFAGLYVAVTHSGVTLGPLLGRLVAEELASGEPPELLTPFRPARFAAR
jgi:glycine/D-amino acid oxidase-like deaminating enzyme